LILCLFSVDIEARSWKKNSFGLFNYHLRDGNTEVLVKNHFQISSADAKLLRHEKTIEHSSPLKHRKNSKSKEIIVGLTAQSSPIWQESDSSTLDLNKEQETAQMCRILYQRQNVKEGLSEGYWIYHKNKINIQSIYTNPEEKLWYAVGRYPKEALGQHGFKLQKNQIIRMGRIRLRVRDIDYPEPKAEEVKSQKS
jgi:hypothetical protein